MPKGGGKVPVVVLVHGSEHDSALDFYALQRMFPAQGIGAFVYDKRGTGASGGTYTQDFERARRRCGECDERSAQACGRARWVASAIRAAAQGGWVVPLAVNRAPVDFAIISFGLGSHGPGGRSGKRRARHVFPSPLGRRH